MLGGDRGAAQSVLLYVSTDPTEPTTQIGLETGWRARMDDQDGARGAAEDFFGHGAEEKMANARSAVTAHDDEVGVHLASLFHDGFGRTTIDHAVLDVHAKDVLALADRL